MLAAFIATPDALHAQALEAVEYVQALRLNRHRVPDLLYLDALDREWTQATTLPEIVIRVHRVVYDVRHEGTIPMTLP